MNVLFPIEFLAKDYCSLHHSTTAILNYTSCYNQLKAKSIVSCTVDYSKNNLVLIDFVDNLIVAIAAVKDGFILAIEGFTSSFMGGFTLKIVGFTSSFILKKAVAKAIIVVTIVSNYKTLVDCCKTFLCSN